MVLVHFSMKRAIKEPLRSGWVIARDDEGLLVQKGGSVNNERSPGLSALVMRPTRIRSAIDQPAAPAADSSKAMRGHAQRFGVFSVVRLV